MSSRNVFDEFLHLFLLTLLPFPVAGSVGLDQSQVKPDKYAIHVDCVMSGFRSMRFEHESIACLSLEFLYENHI